MSGLIDLYNKSTKQRVADARQIPGQETDMWDQEQEFAAGFKGSKTPHSPTDFTPRALEEYDVSKAELVPPESFNSELPLHQYTPETPFYNPGAGK